MRLTELEINKLELNLSEKPVGFATVEIRLSFYKDESDTANVVTIKVRIAATDQQTIAEIRERALAEAQETLRLAIRTCDEKPLSELVTFRSEIYPPP